LKAASGKGPGGLINRLHEQFGYAYDKAWNLNYRTNNALVQNFNVNTLVELDTPTNAMAMPAEFIWHWNGFSATNDEKARLHQTLNSQMPCPPRGAVPVHTRMPFKFFHPQHPVHRIRQPNSLLIM
jgi:hypothetical protein